MKKKILLNLVAACMAIIALMAAAPLPIIAQAETPVIPGKIYQYADTFTSYSSGSLVARFRMTDGTSFSLLHLGPFTPATNASASVTFTAIPGSESVSVLRGIGGSGSMTIASSSITEKGTQPVPTGMVSFNFDDGWRTTYNNAIPILDAAGLKSTNYIITGRFSDPSFINASDVLNLQTRGHEIGAHTRTHQDLTQMNAADLDSEIAGSRADLFSIGAIGVKTFAYPFGSFNDAVIQYVKNASFIGARSTWGGYNVVGTDKYILQRQNLGGSLTISQVKGWIDTAIAQNSWVILLAHHVDSTTGGYSITPTFFQQIVDYAVQKNVKVVTMTEGINLLH